MLLPNKESGLVGRDKGITIANQFPFQGISKRTFRIINNKKELDFFSLYKLAVTTPQNLEHLNH